MTTEITEAPTTQLIGQPIKRVEDPRLITGAAKYLDDLKLPGMAHVAILRSPYAHARISAIRTEAAAASPGVIAVFTGKDFEHLNPLPCAWQAAGTENFVATPRALEIDRVTFTGAGVAAVVAETQAAAEDALGLIEVAWEPLPVVVDVEAAVAAGAPQIHEAAASNVVMDWSCGDAQATEQALAEADVVVEQRLVNQRLIPTPMETRGAAAQYEPSTGEYTGWMTSQAPHVMRLLMTAVVFGIPAIPCGVRGVSTTPGMVAAYRGAGRPEATSAVERAVDLVARKLGLAPVDVRRRNFIPADAFPYDPGVLNGLKYDTGDYEKTLDRALEIVGYGDFRAKQEQARKEGRYLGIGFSSYVEMCGVAPSAWIGVGGEGWGAGLWESANVRVHLTGKVVLTTR